MAIATTDLRLPSQSLTEAHVCEQLAQGRSLTAERLGVELATSETQANALTITPAGTRGRKALH